MTKAIDATDVCEGQATRTPYHAQWFPVPGDRWVGDVGGFTVVRVDVVAIPRGSNRTVTFSQRVWATCDGGQFVPVGAGVDCAGGGK